MSRRIFLSVPSRCCDVHSLPNGVPNPQELRELLALIRSTGMEVYCPMELVKWDSTQLTDNPKLSMAERLDRISECEHFVAFPTVGRHTSPGVMLLLGIAYQSGAKITVALPGENYHMDVMWQIKGLKENIDSGDLDVIFYRGSIADCWPRMKERLNPPGMSPPPSPLANELSNAYPCPFPGMESYWKHRTDYFSRWYSENGREQIQCDKVGLYTVKPERAAAEIAKQIRGLRVVDLFAGVGGVTIALALAGKKVTAIERDYKRVKMLENNCRVYGVLDKVEIIHGDAVEMSDKLECDTAYLDPPWGGPSYRDRRSFTMKDFRVDGARTNGRNTLEGVVGSMLNRDIEVAITVPNNFDLPGYTKFIKRVIEKDPAKMNRDLHVLWGVSGERLLFMTLIASVIDADKS